MKGLGRLKGCSGKEGRLSAVVEADGAVLSVIKESEMMLEWSAEHAAESRESSSIWNSCWLRRTWNEVCTIWISCCSRCIQHS